MRVLHLLNAIACTMNAKCGYELMRDYTYPMFCEDIALLTHDLQSSIPDMIIAVARGGLMVSQFLAHALDVRRVASIQAILYDHETKGESVWLETLPLLEGVSRVLVVDEMVDSGETMHALITQLSQAYPSIVFQSAVLLQKPTAIYKADFYAHTVDEWINFFWEQPLKVF